MKHLLGLRALLPLSIFSVFVVVLSISVFMSITKSVEDLRAQSLQNLRQNILNVTHIAERTIEGDSQILEDSITQLGTNPLVESVAVIRPDGIIVFGSNFSWREERAAMVVPLFIPSAFQQAQKTRQTIVEYNEEAQTYIGLMSFSYPEKTASLRSLKKGVIFLSYNISAIVGNARISAIYQRLPDMVLMLVLAIILMRILHRYVVVPIETIKVASANIGEGRFNAEIKPTGPAEIKDLTRSFNRMNKQLSETISELDDRTQQIQGILDNTFDGIITINTSGIILSFNATAESMFQLDAKAVIGKKVNMLMPSFYADQHDQFVDNYVKGKDARIIGIGREVQGQRNDGSVFPLDLAVTMVESTGEKIFIGIVRDITERKDKEKEVESIQKSLFAANERLEKLVRTDGLTGVYNRRFFDESIATEFNRAMRSGHPVALLLFDVDFFKKYNDRYGHIDGDQCLINIAQAAKLLFQRSGEIVTRYGGEEFAVIVPNASIDEAEKSAWILQKKIEDLQIEHLDSPHSHFVTVSIGVASVVPTLHKTTKDLVLYADSALYRAKENGRNQVATHAEYPSPKIVYSSRSS